MQILNWADPKVTQASEELKKDLESMTDPHFSMEVGDMTYNKDALLKELEAKTEFALQLVENYLKGINFLGNV